VSTTRVEVEEIEATKSEKALAVVLTVFLLIGAIWTYAKLDDLARGSVAPAATAPADRAAVDRSRLAENRQFNAQQAVGQAQQDLVLAREAYRTALDAGQKAPGLRRAYELAQARSARAHARLATARAAAAAARPAAARAERAMVGRQRATDDRRAWLAAGLRLAFTAALLVVGYLLLARLRRRRTRYLPLAFAVIATAAITALTFACDYLTDYIDPLQLGPLVLSLFGIAATIAAFAVLQRYLARRIPIRRVRKGECPFCGFPVRGGGAHCEGCGREVVGACAACRSPRRVGAAHCAACGAV
jgi:hypothetical protein